MICGSRPSRARGLKLPERNHRFICVRSRPSRARGLKHILDDFIIRLRESRPSRARGLKLSERNHRFIRVRGRALHGRVD